MSTSKIEAFIEKRFHESFEDAFRTGTIGCPNDLYYLIRDIMTSGTIDYELGMATDLVEYAVVKYLAFVKWNRLYYKYKVLANQVPQTEELCELKGE